MYEGNRQTAGPVSPEQVKEDYEDMLGKIIEEQKNL